MSWRNQRGVCITVSYMDSSVGFSWLKLRNSPTSPQSSSLWREKSCVNGKAFQWGCSDTFTCFHVVLCQDTETFAVILCLFVNHDLQKQSLLSTWVGHYVLCKLHVPNTTRVDLFDVWKQGISFLTLFSWKPCLWKPPHLPVLNETHLQLQLKQTAACTLTSYFQCIRVKLNRKNSWSCEQLVTREIKRSNLTTNPPFRANALLFWTSSVFIWISKLWLNSET